MRKKQIAEIERVNADTKTGLSKEEVAIRTKNNYVNNTKQKTSKSYLKIFRDNICTFFNLVWLIIFVALVWVKEYPSLLFIVIVVANTAISIFQEIRSKRVVEKLSLVTAPKITVIRNGEEVEISTNEIVIDEIIKIEIGNQIPADSILLEGEVEVNESLLTGESVPVKKQAGDQLFAGSFITSGLCYARVDKVGKDSYIQTIAKEAKEFKQPNSNLFNDLNKIIKYIGISLIPIGAIMFFHNYNLVGASEINKVVGTTCGSLAGMIPSGMYLLVSVALAVGVMKLAKKKTLVQNLYSIEMLARTNVLCLDKTGTITDGTMSVKEVIKIKDDVDFTKGISNLLNVQPTLNHTSGALVKYFGKNDEFTLSHNIPFSSDRKYTVSSFEKEGTFVIGALEYIKPKKNAEVEEKLDFYTKNGYRVLIVAHSKDVISSDELPKNLETKALVVIEDTIRTDAIETIKWFKDNDVEIKIISGDNPQTVSFIAGRVGVENADKFINLEGKTLEEVKELAPKYTVFGRVSPEQKHAIICSLKANKKVVAMTGDGVNDTLALKEADCSIAMADGSEVARNISHLVLLDSKFSSLPAVVEEGRRVVNNVQSSSSLFFMKTLFTIMLSLLILPFGLSYPFMPKQMFMLEFCVIGVPSFFLALLPNKKLIKGHFITNVLRNSIPYGILMFVSVFFTINLGNGFLLEDVETTTMATIIVTIVGFLNLISLCNPFSKYKLAIIAFSAVSLTLAGFVMPTFFGIETEMTVIMFKLWAFITVFSMLYLTLYNLIKSIRNVHKLKKELK